MNQPSRMVADVTHGDGVRADLAQLPRLRVLHLGKYYPPAPGGIESHVETLAATQAEFGQQVRVLCVNHGDQSNETIAEEVSGVSITRLGRAGAVAKMELCPGLRAQILQACHDSDIVHLHVPNPTMLLTLFSMRIPKPIVVTYHSDVVRQRFLGLLQRPFETAVYNRTSTILASSPPYAEGSATLRRFSDRVRVLPFGIRLDPFRNPKPAARKHAEQIVSDFGQPLWLCIGRLVYYKGFDVAIRALSSVPGKLLIIGTGPLESRLRKLADDEGVADRIIWQGNVSQDEMVAAYHAATALWFPSVARSEAFGLVQVESMASGCPVINTAIEDSGVPWVGRDGDTSLTVPVNDVESFAAAANRMLDDDLRSRLSANAAKSAVERFDHRRMATDTLIAYQQAIESQGQRQ